MPERARPQSDDRPREDLIASSRSAYKNSLRLVGAPDRRDFLRRSAAALSLSIPVRAANAAVILGVRVWPARDYTRVTLELDRALTYRYHTLANPHRLVVDLVGLDIDSEIRDLIAKVRADDPYIAMVRVGHPNRKEVRLVFDLRTAVEPEVFALEPVARYQHRLVIDLHPMNERDPALDLVAQEQGQGGALPPKQQDAIRDAQPDPLAKLLGEARTKHQRDAAKSGDKAKMPAPDNQSDNATTSTNVARAAAEVPGSVQPFRRLVTIAIDAGHGGEDPGAIGRRGTYEKDVVLAIAAELRQYIRMEPGMRAFMTREGDYFVPLESRTRKAERVGADLFVSIHADAFVHPQARGASVYVLSERGATSTAASWLADRENMSDKVGGVNQKPMRNDLVRKLLVEMSANAKLIESDRLGARVLAELRDVADLHKRSIERAGFAVLKTPEIPAILVETAFISNPDEEKRLGDPRYRRKVAKAIFEGLKKYIAAHPPAARATL